MRQLIPVIFALLLSTSLNAGNTDIYQEQITKSFPGFVIMSRTEFTQEIQQMLKTHPALIIGKFNQDKIDDFAALIRGTTKKKKTMSDGYSFEYYEIKLVVCQGLGNQKYECKEISSTSTPTLPDYRYLIKDAPGKINCDVHGENYLDVKTDSIAWIFGEVAASQYIHQPDGSYLRCTTAD